MLRCDKMVLLGSNDRRCNKLFGSRDKLSSKKINQSTSGHTDSYLQRGKKTWGRTCKRIECSRFYGGDRTGNQSGFRCRENTANSLRSRSWNKSRKRRDLNIIRSSAAAFLYDCWRRAICGHEMGLRMMSCDAKTHSFCLLFVCMYACLSVLSVCFSVCLYACMRIRARVCLSICMHAILPVCLLVCVYLCTLYSMHTCTHICFCVCLYEFVCM